MGYEGFKRSFLSHVVDKHDELDDPLYNKCSHGELNTKKVDSSRYA